MKNTSFENKSFHLPKCIIDDFEFLRESNLLDWSRFEKKRFLITGANGSIAFYLLLFLIYLKEVDFDDSLHIQVVVRDKQRFIRKLSQFFPEDSVEILVSDLSKELPENLESDFILHAANNAVPNKFITDPVGTLATNLVGTQHVLEHAYKSNCQGILFFSSGEVNGDVFDGDGDPVGEMDLAALEPSVARNSYAIGKLAGEALCNAWSIQHGVPAKIVRPSHTYGPFFDAQDSRAMFYFARSAVEGNDISLNSNGAARRSFCYIADAALAYFLVLLEGKPGTAYNVSNSYETSIFDLAKTIADLSLENIQIKINDVHQNSAITSSRASGGQLSIERIRQLGWEPTISEKVGFQKVMDFLAGKYNDQ